MSRRVFLFDEPDRFLAVAHGAPGSRTFMLQASQGRAVVTLGLEKMQVAALVERIERVLQEAGPGPSPVSSDRTLDATPAHPMLPVFQVGVLALGWDPVAAALLIEARAANEDGDYPEVEDDDPDGPDLLRVRLSAAQASHFAAGASAVVRAGRPLCPLCGEPLDPSGHFCARGASALN